MSVRTMMVLVLALVCGLGAAGGIFWLRRQPAASSLIETTPVIFATVDIQRGETIKEDMIELRQIPVDQVTMPGISDVDEVVDRSAHIPMLKGDVVSDAKLLPKGSGAGMASLIKPGMRAFTIQTPSLSSSLAGFLLPGNRVDVLFTVTSSGGPDDPAGGATTSTLLMDVEILAVHTTVETPAANKIDPKEALSVTLLVKPQEAALLDLGQNKGTLHLSLRNPNDKGIDRAKPARMVDIQADSEKKLVRLEVPKPTPVPQGPPPGPVEVTFLLRTLRGTQAGADKLTLQLPAPSSYGRSEPTASTPGDKLVETTLLSPFSP